MEEETGIKCNPEYWGTDHKFNCDIYTYRLKKETLKWKESQKNGLWIHYTQDEYQNLAKAEETTPTHTTYWEEILEFLNTKVPSPIPIRSWRIDEQEWKDAQEGQNYLIKQSEYGLQNTP